MTDTPSPTRRIPVVDLGELGLDHDAEPTEKEWQRVARQLHEAFTGIGFVYLTNHGVPKDQLEHLFKLNAELFSLDQCTKERYTRDQKLQHGYVAIDREILDEQQNSHELRESFDLKFRDGPMPDEKLPSFRPTITAFFKTCLTLTNRLLTALAISLELDRNFFVSTHKEIFSSNNMSCVRLLHYPPVPDNIPENSIRCGAHTDYGTITLLFQDDMGGLQVREKGGPWVEAVPIPDTILVNVGDLLQFWTADKFIATEHRVLIPKEELRLKSCRRSMVFFVHPDDPVLIQPLDGSGSHQPITAAQHVINRFKATYNY